jgi:hypothetical protein
MPHDPLEVLSKRELITLIRRREVRIDDVDLHLMQEAVFFRLKQLDSRAREGREVMEAMDFAHWCTRLRKLFHGPTLARFEELHRELEFSCERAFANKPRGQSIEERESTHEKPNRLLTAVAQAFPNVPALEGPNKITLLEERS